MTRYAVEYDDAILAALATTPEAFEGEARLLLAAKLFELKRVGVSALNLTAEELDEGDFQHARAD